MKRLFCLIFGHGRDINHTDGRGAAWTTCDRCGKVTGTWSWHGDKPWERTP